MISCFITILERIGSKDSRFNINKWKSVTREWKKNEIKTWIEYYRFDFDDSTFSPPSHDDNFFCIRYSKKQETNQNSADKGFRPITEVFNENKNITAATQVTSSQPSPPDFKAVKEVDFSKHPLPCQPFVPNAAQKGQSIVHIEAVP